MDSPDISQSYGRKDREDDIDRKSDRAGDDAEWEGSDRRKQRSSKSRKPGSGDDVDGFDSSGRRRNSGDKYEGRKRSTGSSRAGSDEEDFDTRKDSRSKQVKRKQEESSLEKLSSWYQDGEVENRQDGGDKLGSKHGRVDESDRRKLTPKSSEYESSQGKSRSKHDRSHEGDTSDKDLKYSERKESSHEKGHGSLEYVKSSKKRWDDVDVKESTSEKNDGRSSRTSDNKYESVRDKSMAARHEFGESKGRVTDSIVDKGMRSDRKDERRHDGKSRSMSEAVEEDNKASPANYEDRTGKEKNEKHRQQRTPTNRDVTESRDGSRHTDEDGSFWSRERSARSHRSRTPDRSSRYARERPDNERSHGRSGNRKDGSRGEAVKTSSNYGISNDNYDVIEIQTRPIDYASADAGSSFARRFEVGQQADTKGPSAEEEWGHAREERARSSIYGSAPSGEDTKERYVEDDLSMRDQNMWRDDGDFQGGKGRGQKGPMPARTPGGQVSSSGSQPPFANQESGSFSRGPNQGAKGNRPGRIGRGRPTGRDNQPVAIPIPMIGASFGPLGMPPPGPMTPGMSPAPGPPISPGVFIPPYSPIWHGARGVDVNMLGVPAGLSPVPQGPTVPRFAPNLGTPPNPAMYYNQSGPGRGGPANIPGPGFNVSGPMGRGTPPDKASGGWVPPRSGGPSHKAPSRGEQNDYSQNFVDTGMRPQNFIRELELTNVVEDYPKLRELIQKKDEIVSKAASPPMYYKCDLREFELTPEFFGTKFDVILVDPPWEEYVHRAPGVADHTEYWTFEEILNLKIEAIADTPSFIFLWVGDGVGLEQGRQCLKKWGFRRCEDICWVKTNKTNATPGLRHDSHTLFQHSKEHCLMGIKGTVRRSTDGHIIHANIDTDVIIAEEPPYDAGSTQKPEDMYRIIEHFALGRRRLELFGEDHNIRTGWLTVGKELSSSNFNAEVQHTSRTLRTRTGRYGKVGEGETHPRMLLISW
ncbi:hypothetical protein EUGRSUZ_C03422 [Eucalyptus grandis]|uniref:Uncharacterized protein n=2 Tax=Eucalyptus grandis TaxID=71139 RepID=A0ACC3LJ56_EUCGR|nr:hypothetical protein EUGRSUZ_C03422 [Eucalyptus grandis]